MTISSINIQFPQILRSVWAQMKRRFWRRKNNGCQRPEHKEFGNQGSFGKRIWESKVGYDQMVLFVFMVRALKIIGLYY